MLVILAHFPLRCTLCTKFTGKKAHKALGYSQKIQEVFYSLTMARSVQFWFFLSVVVALVISSSADQSSSTEKSQPRPIHLVLPALPNLKFPTLDLGVNSASGRSVVDTILSVTQQGLNFALNVDPNSRHEAHSPQTRTLTTDLGKSLSNRGAGHSDQSSGPVNVGLSIGFPSVSPSSRAEPAKSSEFGRAKRHIPYSRIFPQGLNGGLNFRPLY